MHVHITGRSTRSRQNVGLLPDVRHDQHQHGLRTPDDPHAGAATGLHPGNTVLEDKALFGGDGLLALRKTVVYNLESEQVTIGQGFAPTSRDAGVAAKNPHMLFEHLKHLYQLRRLSLEGPGGRASWEGGVNPLGSALGLLSLPDLRATQVFEEFLYTGKGLCAGEEHLLVLGNPLSIFGIGHRELSPVLEDLGSGISVAAHHLGLDLPREGRSAVLGQYQAVTLPYRGGARPCRIGRPARGEWLG